MKDLRQFERFVLDAPAKLLMKDSDPPTRAIYSVAHDISSGGAFIELSDISLPYGDDVDIEIHLSISSITSLFGSSNEVVLRAKANVIRRTAEGIGVIFRGKRMMTAL